MTNWKSGPAPDKDSSQHRGLSQLRNFIDDASYTKFGLSYVQRFLAKAFHGFSVVDPDDLNNFRNGYPRCDKFFPEYQTCSGEKFPGTLCCKKRRWPPSPCPQPYLIEIIGDQNQVTTSWLVLSARGVP